MEEKIIVCPGRNMIVGVTIAKNFKKNIKEGKQKIKELLEDGISI